MIARILSLWLATGILSAAGGEDGLAVARKVEGRETPKDLSADLVMVLTNSKGQSRVSRIHAVSKDRGDKQILWFLEPKEDRGVSFLKIERTGIADEMRLWLPAFKKVKRIAAEERGGAFMGSDLSYEDMANRDVDDYTYQLLQEETIDGQPCAVLESAVKPEVKSQYSRHVTWVLKDGFHPVREESFDKAGRMAKRTAWKYQMAGGYRVIQEIGVKNLVKDHSTRLTFEKVAVDTGVSDNQFQELHLKRLPQ